MSCTSRHSKEAVSALPNNPLLLQLRRIRPTQSFCVHITPHLSQPSRCLLLPKPVHSAHCSANILFMIKTCCTSGLALFYYIALFYQHCLGLNFSRKMILHRRRKTRFYQQIAVTLTTCLIMRKLVMSLARSKNEINERLLS